MPYVVNLTGDEIYRDPITDTTFDLLASRLPAEKLNSECLCSNSTIPTTNEWIVSASQFALNTFTFFEAHREASWVLSMKTARYEASYGAISINFLLQKLLRWPLWVV